MRDSWTPTRRSDARPDPQDQHANRTNPIPRLSPSASAPTGVRWPRPGSPNGSERRPDRQNQTPERGHHDRGDAQRLGTGGNPEVQPRRREIHAPETEKTVEVGSLDSVFGLLEIMPEIIDLLDDAAVTAQWVNYCKLYNGTSAEQVALTGTAWGSQNLRQAYSRATAFAAHQLEDPALAKRAWKEFRTGHAGYPEGKDFSSVRFKGQSPSSPLTRPPSAPTPARNTDWPPSSCSHWFPSTSDPSRHCPPGGRTPNPPARPSTQSFQLHRRP